MSSPQVLAHRAMFTEVDGYEIPTSPAFVNIMDKFASIAHEEWLAARIASGNCDPRIKKCNDGSETNIAVPWEKLHPDWKVSNLDAARFVLALLMKIRGLPEVVYYEAIHANWLRANPYAIGEELDVPFAALPQIEKDKDVANYRLGVAFLAQWHTTL